MLSLQSIPPPLLFLYAETHFRFFPGFPSLLFRRVPEVLFDVPRRVAPGKDIPVMLMLNDIERFPARLIRAAIAVSRRGHPPRVYEFDRPDDHLVHHPLESGSRVYVFRLPADGHAEHRQLYVNGRATIRVGKKEYEVLNDNLPGSSKRALSCTQAAEELPGSAYCSYGDLHVHSQFSQSHVEFGPPISVIAQIASSYGLDFIAITDHSYDIACSVEDPYRQDPGIRRWELMLREVERARHYLPVIPGEEISCLNRAGKVVHLCGLGLDTYVPGTLDGARRNRVHRRQLSIHQAVEEIHRQGGLAVPAHPGVRPSLAQRLFLHRGTWTPCDFGAPVDGIQALNNGYGPAWSRGKALWVHALARGRRLWPAGGNDSHGDFCRYRSIGTPFVSILEMFDRYLGYGRTGLYGKVSSPNQALTLLRRGAAFVTTGPFIGLSRTDSPEDAVIANSDTQLEKGELFVNAISTYEFGPLRGLAVFCADGAGGTESVIYRREFTSRQLLRACESFSLPPGVHAGYVRAEVTARSDHGEISRAVSGPCYFNR